MTKGIDAEIKRVGKFALPIDFLALKVAVDDVGGEFGGMDGGGYATGSRNSAALPNSAKWRPYSALTLAE